MAQPAALAAFRAELARPVRAEAAAAEVSAAGEKEVVEVEAAALKGVVAMAASTALRARRLALGQAASIRRSPLARFAPHMARLIVVAVMGHRLLYCWLGLRHLR